MAVNDVISGAHIKVYSITGPASYLTGGFLHDASADFSWIGFVDLIQTVRDSDLNGPFDYEILPNRNLASAEAFGQVTIKLNRGQWDRETLGNVTGQPGGVTVQAAKTATATSTSHLHDITHNHAVVTSAVPVNAGTLGQLLDALGAANLMLTHTHNFDVPNFVGNTVANLHTHDRSFEYDHSHSLTTAVTDVALSEVPNATNLSGATFKLVVYGFGKA